MGQNNSGGGLVSKWLGAVRRSLATESGAIVAGLLTSFGVEALPEEFIAYLSNQISPTLLGSNKLQRVTARTASSMLGLGEDEQEAAEAIIMDFFETVSERSKKLTGNKDEDEELIRAVLRKLKGDKDSGGDAEEEEMAGKKDPKPAAPVAPPEKTLLQVVGELEPGKQGEFWVAVTTITNPLSAQDKSDFEARISRVTLTKEAVLGLLANPDLASRASMLQQAVKNAYNAGGLAGGFRSLMDSASDAMRSATSGITSSSPDKLREKLVATNTRRKREDDDVGGIR